MLKITIITLNTKDVGGDIIKTPHQVFFFVSF
jgi:hypothetical protein